MKRLQTVFVTGLLLVVPLTATMYLLLWFTQTVDHGIRTIFPTYILPFDFEGLGVVIALVFIFLTGLLAQNYIGTWLVSLFDSTIKRIPLGGGIYAGIKKFLETVFNPNSDKFKGVVLVEFPRNGVWSIGFRTGMPDPKLARKIPDQTLLNVFVPCTPNPTSGFYLLVPENQVVALDMTVQEAFKIVISMGIVTTEDIQVKP